MVSIHGPPNMRKISKIAISITRLIIDYSLIFLLFRNMWSGAIIYQSW